MGYVIGGILIIGFIGLIATVIKYPKDVSRGLFATFLLPFERIWHLVSLILLPISILILFIEGKLGVNYLTKLIDRESRQTKRRTKERKNINFKNFKKYIVVNSTSEQIEDELAEANECCPEVTIEHISICRTRDYSVIETPDNGFYGYNFLIQWLTEHLTTNQVVGFASNGQNSFITTSNPQGDNDLVGRTNTGSKFWVSMYDDLDNNQFLRLNDELELSSELTTESLGKMVRHALNSRSPG